jgi:hypothetical protein
VNSYNKYTNIFLPSSQLFIPKLNFIPFTVKQRVGELGRKHRKPAVKLWGSSGFRQGPNFFSSCVVKQLFAIAYERIVRITHNAEITAKLNEKLTIAVIKMAILNI